jgi:hypothetical protein
MITSNVSGVTFVPSVTTSQVRNLTADQIFVVAN